ncbi:hypothetical protein [Pseudoalteromonas sp. PS5]|uniref:hypothetical protein n=1 Tax=Pseudoalteromonas sp. PS5 TaxID=1437473 RepID=UPI000FFE50CF|nr:hypothetical protein [Pseudoalteromonas sp. PS5]RXE96038.1 hypothetical protein D9603_19280 [Pseudoalteromonas sp. PS5]
MLAVSLMEKYIRYECIPGLEDLFACLGTKYVTEEQYLQMASDIRKVHSNLSGMDVVYYGDIFDTAVFFELEAAKVGVRSNLKKQIRGG